jgi:hypothetical protein
MRASSETLRTAINAAAVSWRGMAGETLNRAIPTGRDECLVITGVFYNIGDLITPVFTPARFSALR